MGVLKTAVGVDVISSWTSLLSCWLEMLYYRETIELIAVSPLNTVEAHKCSGVDSIQSSRKNVRPQILSLTIFWAEV